MSFLIVYNGQFSPLVHPVGTSAREVIAPVTPLDHSAEIDEFEEVMKDVGEEVPAKKPHPQLAIYQQATKKFEAERKRYYAKDIMSSPVQLISQTASASTAQTLLLKNNFRQLPVVDEKNVIVGMISDREFTGQVENKTCQDIMLQKIIVCQEQTSINEIAITLLKEKINVLPIINHQHELTGIITLSDILKYVVESTPFLGHG
jgi:CBS-domain-containing membrane protein